MDVIMFIAMKTGTKEGNQKQDASFSSSIKPAVTVARSKRDWKAKLADQNPISAVTEHLSGQEGLGQRSHGPFAGPLFV